MNHAQVAVEVARGIAIGAETPLMAKVSARQGDLVLRRVGEARAKGESTPGCGVVVAAGSHGEHRLIADSYARKGSLVDLPAGGLVVHTDVPAGRHGSIQLAPGRWEILHQREVGLDEAVVRVRD